MTMSTTSEDAMTTMGQRVTYPSLSGKSVLITGGASGLGLAFAEAFAANGAHLTLLDINSEGLARVSENLKTANPGIGVGTACGSTTDEAAVEAAFAQAVSRFGRIDVLLNNAGIGMVKPTLELSAAESAEHSGHKSDGGLSVRQGGRKVYDAAGPRCHP